jgi:hypothetical protein
VIKWSVVLDKYVLCDLGSLMDVAVGLMAVGYIVDKAV